MTDGNRSPHSKPHDHDRNHMHDLAADGHRRSAFHRIKLSYDIQVRHPVERLQKIRQKIRQGKGKQCLKYISCCQILCVSFFHHLLSFI